MRYFVANLEKSWGRWIEAPTGFEARKIVAATYQDSYPRDFIALPARYMDASEVAWADALAGRA